MERVRVVVWLRRRGPAVPQWSRCDSCVSALPAIEMTLGTHNLMTSAKKEEEGRKKIPVRGNLPSHHFLDLISTKFVYHNKVQDAHNHVCKSSYMELEMDTRTSRQLEEFLETKRSVE